MKLVSLNKGRDGTVHLSFDERIRVEIFDDSGASVCNAIDQVIEKNGGSS